MLVDQIDLIIKNGKILTLNSEDLVAEAVAVKDEEILAVGSSNDILSLKTKDTEVIDLKGKAVIPGFIDAHTHLDLYGMMTSEYVVSCHIPALKSVQDILEKLKEAVDNRPKGELILGQGRAVQPYPSKEELDKIAPYHPIIIKATMHDYILNECALKKFKINSEKPTFEELFNITPGSTIERDKKTGEPTGKVVDIWDYMFPGTHNPFNYKKTYASLQNGLDTMTKYGVTSVADFYCYGESPGIYQEMYRNGELNVRLQLVPCFFGFNKTVELNEIINVGLTSGFGDRWVKFGGLKIFLDLNHHTTCTTAELNEWFSKAHNSGLRVFMHALTKTTQDMALSVIEAEVERSGLEDVKKMRYRIEHLGNEEHDSNYLSRAKKTGAIGLPTAYFMNIGEFGLMSAPTDKKFVFRSMLDLGLCVPGNSDAAGSIPEAVNPFYQIWCMVSRKKRNGELLSPSEKISVLEALKVYTNHSAFAGCEENIKGSIEEGKLADFAVLSRDPLEVSVDELLDIKVDMTIVGGKVVYKR